MKKTFLYITCALILMLSTMPGLQIRKVKAADSTVVYVDPPTTYASLDDTFSINVSIANVTFLYGYEFRLLYDTTILDCLSVVMPPGHFLTPLDPENIMLVHKEIKDHFNATHGRVWFACSLLGTENAKDGSGILTTITFKVTGTGNCTIDLGVPNPSYPVPPAYVNLASPKAEPISHSVKDGYFEFVPPEHDVVAFVDAPTHLFPGNSTLLNATALNGGLNNETYVELRLLVNASIVNSTVVSLLEVGSSFTISYLLTTTSETTYNVTAYALAVPNEENTLNNMESARVLVTYVIRVPYHYSTIQEAIDSGSPRVTILVSAGTYYEHLTVDKSLSLEGEGSTPIIDGVGVDTCILVTADNVNISKFTIQNGLWGIRIDHADGNVISNNMIRFIRNGTGIDVYEGHNNIIIGNKISDNYAGIDLMFTDNNVIYHNSFINNTHQRNLGASLDIWDNGCEGNYWSDYNGTDLDGDGVGDTYLPWQGVDYYPLMNPYIPGDVNHDAIVDIFDGVTIAMAYDSTPSSPNWNPHSNLIEDRIIDIFDIIKWGTHFGETYP